MEEKGIDNKGTNWGRPGDAVWGNYAYTKTGCHMFVEKLT